MSLNDVLFQHRFFTFKQFQNIGLKNVSTLCDQLFKINDGKLINFRKVTRTIKMNYREKDLIAFVFTEMLYDEMIIRIES